MQCQGKEIHEQYSSRGITPIGDMSRAATGMKMQSNGQCTHRGMIKWSSGVFGSSNVILLVLEFSHV